MVKREIRPGTVTEHLAIVLLVKRVCCSDLAVATHSLNVVRNCLSVAEPMVWSVFERGGGIQAKVVNGRPDALGAPDRGFTNDNNVVG